MDWYSYWIEEHVLVQTVRFYGSYYAHLHCYASCIWWSAATILSQPNVMMYDHHNRLGDHPDFWCVLRIGCKV